MAGSLAEGVSDGSVEGGGQGFGPRQTSCRDGHPVDGLQMVGALVLQRLGLGPRGARQVHRRLCCCVRVVAGVLVAGVLLLIFFSDRVEVVVRPAGLSIRLQPHRKSV